MSNMRHCNPPKPSFKLHQLRSYNAGHCLQIGIESSAGYVCLGLGMSVSKCLSFLSGETKREKDFYKKRGLPYPKAINGPNAEKEIAPNKLHPEAVKSSNGNSNSSNATEDTADYHRSDEQVNILLESQNGSNLKSMKRKFIRCSAHTTVTHIKKFVAKKLYNNFDRYKDASNIVTVSDSLMFSQSCSNLIFASLD